MSYIEIIGMQKHFKEHIALQGIDLAIEKGEFLTLLGPSGCGKSTLLRILAGFIDGDQGMISIGGKDISHVPANKRDMGFVFQSYALFPNMNVFDNVAFGLKMRHIGKSDITKRVHSILETVGLADRAHYMTQELSGGQQQRVALARALAPQPSVLLLDEPLSALDANTRLSMREFLKNIQRLLGITTIFVTHDQEEALSISDSIAIMRDGKVVQQGTPKDLYHYPNSPFVAQFIGTTNLLPITKHEGQRVYVPFPLDIDRPIDIKCSCVAIRPEMITLQLSYDPQQLTGIIINKTLFGSIVRYTVQVEGGPLVVDMLHNPSYTEGFTADMVVGITIPAKACNLLP